MHDSNKSPFDERAADPVAEVAAADGRVFPTLPLRISGLYEKRPIRGSSPIPIPIPSTPAAAVFSDDGMNELSPLGLLREELRLDVDGYFPQQVASGTLFWTLTKRVHWIAKLTPTAPRTWKGTIWYKDGDVASFPYTAVEITAKHDFQPSLQTVTIRFLGAGTAVRTQTLKFKSPYFRTVEFEFDAVDGESTGTTIDTHAHPNHPAALPKENLSIETVYRRAGFDVTKSPSGDNIVPITGAGVNARWSDNEMHDAMQQYWSRFANDAQWSMWVFFASLHDQGTSLGGIMFDDVGAHQRQGTAIFNDSFISVPPSGDPDPKAWVDRMIFWTACHEMGHAFNLAHAWQKSLGTPWVPLANEPAARSFMNYPYAIAGGQTAFFSDFEYRFSNNELVFMRHAPERFVRMGDAAWFDDHGFTQANVSPEPPLKLELRVDRPKAIYQFMEPVVLELRVTNISRNPIVIDDKLLTMIDRMTVILKKDGRTARYFTPYARHFYESNKRVLMPSECLAESLFVSVGRNGWEIAEPGYYTIQVALHMETEDIVSAPLRLRVTPPSSYDEEWLAQDFFSDPVGRILTFDGSRFFDEGNDTLREISERLNDRPVAHHAQVALAIPLSRGYKYLEVNDPESARGSGHAIGGRIRVVPPQPDEARHLYSAALLEDKECSLQTLGRIDYQYYIGRLGESLAAQGVTEHTKDNSREIEHTLRSMKDAISSLREYSHMSR